MTALAPGVGCTIHVGLPKTGTSTLQAGLFSQHSSLLYLGKYALSNPERYESGLIELINPILQADNAALTAADARAWADARVRESRDHGKPLLLSDEAIMSTGPRMRERRLAILQDLFGPCRAIITLREPVALIESLYFHVMLRRRLVLDPRMGRREGYWIPIEEWLDRSWAKPHKGPLCNLEYAATAQLLAEALGRENVAIFLTEQLREDSAAYYRSICGFLGVDEDEGIEVASGLHVNPRQTQGQYEAFRRASTSPMGRFTLRWAPLRFRKKLQSKIQSANCFTERPEAPIPARWVEKIGDLTRPGNDAIVREWGLPLDRYGYSVT